MPNQACIAWITCAFHMPTATGAHAIPTRPALRGPPGGGFCRRLAPTLPGGGATRVGPGEAGRCCSVGGERCQAEGPDGDGAPRHMLGRTA